MSNKEPAYSLVQLICGRFLSINNLIFQTRSYDRGEYKDNPVSTQKVRISCLEIPKDSGGES
jgi:hypothetical protein